MPKLKKPEGSRHVSGAMPPFWLYVTSRDEGLVWRSTAASCSRTLKFIEKFDRDPFHLVLVRPLLYLLAMNNSHMMFSTNH